MAHFNPFDLVFGTVKATNPVAAVVIDLAHTAIDKTLMTPAVKDATKAEIAATVKAEVAVMEKSLGKELTIAPVQTPWVSKINWIQLIGPIASIVSTLGVAITEQQLNALVVATPFVVHVVQSVVTWIVRTWFTKSILAPSVMRK